MQKYFGSLSRKGGANRKKAIAKLFALDANVKIVLQFFFKAKSFSIAF